MDVHLARTLAHQVQALAEERIARARLNQLMGEPLTAMFALDLAPPADAIDLTHPDVLEEDAVKNRPEIALARQQEQLAAATVDTARAAFLPQVTAQGAWELNGGSWDSRSSSWVVGAAARINVFRGLADKARLAETREQAARRAIETGKAETMVRLDVQIAIAGLEAARASEAVGRTAADSARASHRIIRDRYESGLADAATLLRAAEAIEQAEALQMATLVNVITATATLQRARGRL
jgi:outer membrane protein TolC